MSHRRTAGLAGCLLSAAGPPKARRSFFRSGRDAGGETVWLAQPETSRAQAAGEAARAELERVRADAEKMLAGFRAEAAAELTQVRADLRARAECAEREGSARAARQHRPRQRQREGRRPDATTHQGRHSAVTRAGRKRKAPVAGEGLPGLGMPRAVLTSRVRCHRSAVPVAAGSWQRPARSGAQGTGSHQCRAGQIPACGFRTGRACGDVHVVRFGRFRCGPRRGLCRPRPHRADQVPRRPPGRRPGRSLCLPRRGRPPRSRAGADTRRTAAIPVRPWRSGDPTAATHRTRHR